MGGTREDTADTAVVQTGRNFLRLPMICTEKQQPFVTSTSAQLTSNTILAKVQWTMLLRDRQHNAVSCYEPHVTRKQHKRDVPNVLTRHSTRQVAELEWGVLVREEHVRGRLVALLALLEPGGGETRDIVSATDAREQASVRVGQSVRMCVGMAGPRHRDTKQHTNQPPNLPSIHQPN